MKFIPGGCVARVRMPGRRHDQRSNKAFLQGPDSGALLFEELRPFPHESGHLRVDGVLNGTEERFHNNAVLVIGFPVIV